MVARIVIAAPATGHGKTSVATGLMAALRARDVAVSGHKIGPDFVDPGYHALATGLPPRNLDPFLQGEDRVAPLLLHGARTADIAVLEGVMGLFDGVLGTAGYASTAHVAKLVRAPVVLVVDASTASRSVAASVLGFARYDPEVRLAGVILNKVDSRPHQEEVREALEPTGIPVLGVLPHDDRARQPGHASDTDREADAERFVAGLADWVAAGIDLDAVVRVARSAPPLTVRAWNPTDHVRPGARRFVVAAASDPAFTFRYTENVELLDAAGIDVVDFDPTRDETLPEACAGLYFGGGFPETRVGALSDNAALRHRVATAIEKGLPVAAERAGLLYLCREFDGAPMVGALDAVARTTDGGALGYRDATAPTDSVSTSRGLTVRGHEFHLTSVEPRHGPDPAWEWEGRSEGFASPTLHASYLHLHWAGHPELACRFASAVRGG
ncbi:cobyrinate a,c-diamide synthase [Saccharomonospora sp.]|uniref:cobyrinate a,c-diamide synthase n=1 Tax=Saccharomonospora sp. TaxID=33913 RepID=UPI00262252CC|nr:cobyrinate a,c-diamide synthase [Saccharomonospora sp.]